MLLALSSIARAQLNPRKKWPVKHPNVIPVMLTDTSGRVYVDSSGQALVKFIAV